MDTVRIQDDLYLYVNQEWLEKAVIPEDRPTAGGFSDLNKEVEELLLKDFKEMLKEGNYPSSYMENAIALFGLALNEKKRNKEGIKPLRKTLDKIDKLTGIPHMNRNLKSLFLMGLPLPFSFSIEEDMMDTSKHCLFLTGPRTFLPDSSYYKPEREAEKNQLLAIWKEATRKVMAFAPLSESDQEQYILDAISFDARIAGLVKSMEEWSEYTKCYNPMKLSRVNSLLKPLKFKKLTFDIFGFELENVIVAEPRYFKGFKTVFNEETFIEYKHWAYVSELLSSAQYTTEELRNLSGLFKRTIMGVPKMQDIDKFASNLASSYFSEPIGVYYGKKYFGEEAKRDVISMVKDIVESYKKRIKKNDFLTEPTKEKAILKLEKMGLKLAYPDDIDPMYDAFIVDKKKSLYQNLVDLSILQRMNNLSKLSKPVDRTKWVMPGHLVNACYNPSLNDITFPAAILQAPFYSIKQTRSQNLGGIGAVIAHEISHAFDNNGAKCDENGNLKNWWTKEDLKNFNQKTKAMIKEFDGIELEWGKVNGKFIVSENIADNGGMAATLDIMREMSEKNYEEYFINWAKVWCLKAKPEYLKLILSIDVHAPAVLRANMQPQNFSEWYETFGVKKTDKMYLPESKRVVIW